MLITQGDPAGWAYFAGYALCPIGHAVRDRLALSRFETGCQVSFARPANAPPLGGLRRSNAARSFTVMTGDKGGAIPLMTTCSRRSLLQSLGAGPLALVGGLDRPPHAPPTPAGTHQSPDRLQVDPRPNILLILLDDLRADDLASMPVVQELLVTQGASFANFFAAAPGCAPARASILRGQYPHSHGVLRGKGEVGGFGQFYRQGLEESTIATWLQEAGYRTALFGKYLNGYPVEVALAGVAATYFPPGWDEWAAYTKEGYFRFEVNENGELVRYGSRESAQYSTDVLAAKATDFVGRMAQAEQPFFLYLAPRAPHGPAEPAPRHASKFTETLTPRPPSFNEVDVTDKPLWARSIPALRADQIAVIDEHYAARLRTLLAVDDLVATLIDALRVAGTLDQTYLVFTSDNGYHLGEHRIFLKKGSPYEEAIRVPLVVRGPGSASRPND